ncbi:hypothetical protein SteCoe_5613 [Stentor coeruleus]|uniref:Uncharacterized protein n=1 Tax=Stentor coeruleus TaxID=5963 RepID=A0A1R2CRX1_9CILI|nr:hypothetical protein SteCoe_5613 [Stentor coeruleus]
MKNNQNSVPKHRSHLLTPSTNWSFNSYSTFSPVSIISKQVDSYETFYTENILDLTIESDLFKKHIDLYFKIDEKSTKINERCMELLIKQNSVHDKLIRTQERIAFFKEDSPSLSLRILQEEGNLENFERDMKKYEAHVREIEEMASMEKRNFRNTENEVKTVNKSFKDSEMMDKELNYFDKVTLKLKLTLQELKGKKQELTEHYKLLTKSKMNFRHFKAEVDKEKKDIESLRLKTERSQKSIEDQREKTQKIQEEYLLAEMRNTEVQHEMKEIMKKFTEISHNNEIRKQWLQDYEQKINSKEALNRILVKNLEEKSQKNLYMSNELSKSSVELDRKEAELEIIENNLKNTEKTFKSQLKTLLKSKKRLKNLKN